MGAGSPVHASFGSAVHADLGVACARGLRTPWRAGQSVAIPLLISGSPVHAAAGPGQEDSGSPVHAASGPGLEGLSPFTYPQSVKGLVLRAIRVQGLGLRFRVGSLKKTFCHIESTSGRMIFSVTKQAYALTKPWKSEKFILPD